MKRKWLFPALFSLLVLLMAACSKDGVQIPDLESVDNTTSIHDVSLPIEQSEKTESEAIDSNQEQMDVQQDDHPTESSSEIEKNGDVVILYTSDVHCAVDQGFGYAGLQRIFEYLVAQGNEVILVDNGDSIQGEPIGTMSKGELMIDLMNQMGYSIAIPGNHEFDYGMDQFLSLTERADFPYISCNFNYQGELVLPPYVIEELAGRKIAFIGVTTPKTLTSSTPKSFQNEEGEYIYGFYQDTTGEDVYQAVQSAVDNARSEGAEIVIVLGHLGNQNSLSPWTYADVIANTTGIDVLLDGHSHDTDQVVMNNKSGQSVLRSACGKNGKYWMVPDFL